MTPEERDQIDPEEVAFDVRRDKELRHTLFRMPEPRPGVPPLYSSRQAARYLGFGVSAIWKHLKAGTLQPFKVGSEFIYDQMLLDDFEDARRPAGFQPRILQSARTDADE